MQEYPQQSRRGKNRRTGVSLSQRGRKPRQRERPRDTSSSSSECDSSLSVFPYLRREPSSCSSREAKYLTFLGRLYVSVKQGGAGKLEITNCDVQFLYSEIVETDTYSAS